MCQLKNTFQPLNDLQSWLAKYEQWRNPCITPSWILFLEQIVCVITVTSNLNYCRVGGGDELHFRSHRWRCRRRTWREQTAASPRVFSVKRSRSNVWLRALCPVIVLVMAPIGKSVRNWGCFPFISGDLPPLFVCLDKWRSESLGDSRLSPDVSPDLTPNLCYNRWSKWISSLYVIIK